MISIALAQMDVPPGQPQANLVRARDFAAQAQEADADLLLLPELWLHGYDLEWAEEWADPLGEGGFAHMAGLAREFGREHGFTDDTGWRIEAGADAGYRFMLGLRIGAAPLPRGRGPALPRLAPSTGAAGRATLGP